MDVFAAAQNLIFDSSDDEEVPIFQLRRPRFIRERLPHFDDLDDIDFARRFRLSKQSALQVLALIDWRLEFPTDKNDAISPVTQLLLCLRFYATGCTQLSAADFSGVSEASANRIVHRVTAALASLYGQYVYFPRNDAEIRQAQTEFYSIARFPKVIGALDCTHVKIRSPGGEHAEYYRCRKGYFSINCQGICNANLEFIDVVARWPGSAHDQTIFDHSRQRALLENNTCGDAVLVADSAYADRAYVMTPLDTVRTQEENLYNEAQIRTRNPVERIYGLWKRRFPILALGMNVRLDRVLPIIIACAILHNILRRNGDPQPPDDNDLQLPMPWVELIEQGQANYQPNRDRRGRLLDNNGRLVTDSDRQALIANYFRTLNRRAK